MIDANENIMNHLECLWLANKDENEEEEEEEEEETTTIQWI